MAAIVMALAIPNKLPTISYGCNFGWKKYSTIQICTVSRRLRAFSISCNGQPCDSPVTTERRSGYYKPSFWSCDYLQSLSSPYMEERYLRRDAELVVEVKKLLEEEFMESVQQLELIDDLQRMGISYHFDDKINQILKSIYDDHQHKYNCMNADHIERDLYSTALEFRLLRQHDFSISQEVFDCFKNDEGDFKESLVGDTRGLLQLYEASFLLTEGEEILEKAKEFATYFLQKKLTDKSINDENLSLLTRQALTLPIHWRTQRLSARCFIDAYWRRSDINPVLLELAKLDFNILQATYQQELKLVSGWWKQTRIAENLPFARDWLAEYYYWTMGWLFEPQYGYARIAATKFVALITVIDDVFDVYATLEELYLFHDAIQRWDIEAVNQLPQYMQMCFLALNNFINEMAYDVFKEQGFLIIPHLRKSWADLCTSYLQEAKWYDGGYTPTLEEYISNASISIACLLALSHTYFLVSNPIEEEAVLSLNMDHDLIRYSSVIFRLADDLGTSADEMKRGDVPKAIECYMKESGSSREEAREYVRSLIRETWKKLNKERVGNSPFPQNIVRSAVDLCRTSQYIYQQQHGEGYGNLSAQIKEHISTLLFEPIL